MHKRIHAQGFTIVELLIVVVVIAILAAITIVSYNGISKSAKEASLKSDLTGAAKQVSNERTTTNLYPTDTTSLKKSGTTSLDYTYDNDSETFCLTATSSGLPGVSYYTTQAGGIQAGTCPLTIMQTVNTANCPATRTRATDARDDHTYWIKKLADGRCWMLTNIGYSGGGDNTYGDAKTLSNGTGVASTYTAARYYIVPSTVNFTVAPANPSASSNGTGQYGYLYNWCGAMGGQATAACANALTPATVASTSICPAGWRLPTGNGGELGALNTAINSGSTSTDSGLLTEWLAHRGGIWTGSFAGQGTDGNYWSSTPYSTASYAYVMYFDSGWVGADVVGKNDAFAVRCIAN